MTKTKQLLMGMMAIAVISFLTVSYASADKGDDPKQKNVWDVIATIQNELNSIQAKLSTTVSVGGNTQTGIGATLPPPSVGTHDHPYKIKVKHTKTHNTSFSPSNPDVYYTSLTMGGDVPIQPILAQTDIPSNCNSVNVGTTDNPDFEVLGWCPDAHQYWYFIQDSRVAPNTLISMNVQSPPVTDAQEAVNPPVCKPTQTGTFQFATQNMTGFIIQCDTNADVPVAGEPLIYIVLN